MLKNLFLLGLAALAMRAEASTITIDFEKPQTTANFPAQFYDNKGKGLTINQGTGGVTVNFTGGELLTGAKAIFPADNTTLYASAFPQINGTADTIAWTYSVPMDNISFLLMNSAGDARNFTFSANGKGLPNTISVADGASKTINFRVNGTWLTNITSVGVTRSHGDKIIAAWSFAVDNIHSTTSAPEPAALFLAGSGLIGVGVWRRKRV